MTLALRYGEKPTDAVTSVEFLSTKVGLAVVVLGIMHFFGMFVLARFKKASRVQVHGKEDGRRGADRRTRQARDRDGSPISVDTVAPA
ncbi:hypothetical protein [Jannaschia aquimarina]|uniref:Uncharacterized protein n=1 Tax=Jannaschia aquimarina TaxID=935700 RepID=A0A0D1E9W2_9RHOB|nr:hypothetical protein [Jannaschia aquimarina]KIT14479.1 hypothetical protein jaqu_37690 [Jannaschia aquimarina]SNT28797.1 hypothetical protein SAMN05421775_11030 [Jannaschia aquimarina]